MSCLARPLLTLMLCLVSLAALAGESYSLHIGTRDRSYLVYRPPGLAQNQAAPLVVVLHGRLGSAAQAERTLHWDREAAAYGFIVAYPESLGNSWNAGGACCGPALRNHIDDSGFITAIIETLIHTQHVDPHRVYVSGFSNGAAMAWRYACDSPFPLAAIGSVSGELTDLCANPAPVSVMEIHGLADQNIPMDGGEGPKALSHIIWKPVRQGIERFRALDQCAAPTVTRDGTVVTDSAACADDMQVVLITIDGAGHQWPGATPLGGLTARLFRPDPPSHALDATDTLWRFFRDKRSP